MTRTAFLNLLFSFLLSIAIAFATYLLGCMVHYLVNELVFYECCGFVPSPKGELIAYIIISLVISGTISGVVNVFWSKRFYSLQDDSWFHEGFGETFVGTVAANLGVLIVGLFFLAIFGTAFNKLLSDISAVENGLLTGEILANIISPIAIATSMLLYFIFMCVGLDTNACSRCHHMGVSFLLEDSETKEYTQYRTTTSREKVGSLSADDVEIAEIYGDVSRTQSRNVKRTTEKYKGKCWCCGYINERIVIESDGDLWG